MKQSSMTTYIGYMSPPPANRTITLCTFTEEKKAFIGLHHQLLESPPTY